MPNVLKSNKAIQEFWSSASDTFRRLAQKTPMKGQEAAFKSGLKKIGSSIANQDMSTFRQTVTDVTAGVTRRGRA